MSSRASNGRPSSFPQGPLTQGTRSFPEGFVWGAGCSAYQLEGGAFDDGKGWSVWDAFCRISGAVFGGQNGDVACDHYHRFKDDVKLMKDVGLRAYRLSVSWPRVMPMGTGAVNEKGLAFYDRLVDELLGAGIEPYITLFHWDYPQELFCRGGWLNRESAEWFADYTKVVIDRLSDRVRQWITINEPQIFLGMGHTDVKHAPGLRLPTREFLRAVHHALLAHGRSVQVIRERAKTPPVIGWAPTGPSGVPASASSADVAAARQFAMGVNEKGGWNHSWYADPVILGHYPEDGLKLFGDDVPKFPASDLATIKQPIDYFGVNIYSGETIRAGTDGKPEIVKRSPGYAQTAFRWWVEPEVLEWTPRFLYERYKTPLVITENGMSGIDWVGADGKCHDPNRIDFTGRYLRALRRAMDSGVPVNGYFHWSIMDNFEWAEGVKERFGLIHVDFATQKRTLKDSAHWYREVIESNGAVLWEGAGAEVTR